MRLVYLVPGPMGGTPSGDAELQRRREFLQRYASPGTEVGIIDSAKGPSSIESMYEEYLSIPETVQLAYELERDGWDGIMLGCYGDPGLDALREIINIPIAGAGEATSLMAASIAHRFSIITISDPSIVPLERLVRNAGVAEKLASVRAVNIPVLDLHKDRERAIEVTLEQGRKAIEQDRAEALIVGCMSMGFLEIPEACQAELGVPFLNPARVQLRFLEAVIGSGLTHSRRSYMTPPKIAAGIAQSPSDLYHIRN